MTTSTTNAVATTVVAFGAVGTYKNQIVLVRAITKCGKKLQLLNLETGDNLVGCPSISSVFISNTWPTGMWNGVEYCYSYEKDTLYTASGVVFKDRSNSQRQQLIRELFTVNQPLAEISCADMVEEDADSFNEAVVDVTPVGVIDVCNVIPTIPEVKEMMYSPIATTKISLAKYFPRYHVKTLAAMAKSNCKDTTVSVKFNGKIKLSANKKYHVFSIPANPAVGMFRAEKFMILREELDLSLVEFCLANIHIGGVHFEEMKSSELFALKIAYAMFANGIGFAKIHEGLKKGYKVFLDSYNLISKKTGKTYRKLSVSTIESVGPMGEGSTGKFTNPLVPADSEFGQNVVTADGKVGRLVFETTKSSDGSLVPASNKVVAREMKLGVGKTDGLTDLGMRSCILIDEALNPKGLSATVKRMLVLGTAWVSGDEYEAYGSCRLIPLKSVTAPLPSSIGTLIKGQILVGGNTHKSKLNGVLRHALGLSHLEISALTEDKARELLKPFVTYIKLNGRSFAAYKFDVNIKATNFYSLYSLEGADLFVDEDGEQDEIKSFFMDALAKVEQASKDGYLFNLKAHIESALEAGEIVRSERMTDVTSAEIQQVGISYGYEAGQRFVDELMTKGNVASKFYLFENMKDLPKISRDDLFNLFKQTIIGEVEPTLVPEKFVLGFYDLVGDDSKGFVVSHNGYDFPFAPVGNMEFEEGYVKDAPASLVALMSFGATLRNSGADWGVKYCNHMAELNGNMLKKVQTMKVRGAYLAAVAGFWLNPTEVFSFGDEAGKVTSAKLPILFDQAITGLVNQNGSDTPYSIEELIRFESHFSRIAFVSPEYFLSQENDGDGDLVKIMKSFKSIPVWSGQPEFAQSKISSYTKGEYDGLKLSLKPYVLMSFESFNSGNWAAKTAKDNVAIMAANEYRVKQCMMPWLTNGTADEKSLARMIAEASAYLVQYEAMRAAKHDGAVSMYSLVQCAPSSENVKDQVEYIDNWSKLLKDYFGYTSDVYAYVLLHKLTCDLYSGKYNGLVPSSYLEGFVSGGVLRGSTFSFAVQQKGYARAISGYAGAFTVPRGKHADEIQALNNSGVKMFRKGGMYSAVYNRVATTVARKMDWNTIAQQGDVFAYFLKALQAAYVVSKLPTSPKPTKDSKESVLVSEVVEALSATVSDVSDVPDVTVDAVMSDDLISTIDTSTEVLKEDDMICNEVAVDSVLVWEEVSSSIVTIVNDGSLAAKSRLAKLKRSIMAAANSFSVFEFAVIEAQSHVMDYNDWAEEYLSDKADDENETDALYWASVADEQEAFEAAEITSEEVFYASLDAAAEIAFQAVKMLAQEVSSCVNEVSACVNVADSVSSSNTKTVFKAVSKPSTTIPSSTRFEVANSGSRRLEGRCFDNVSLDDLSSADFRAMKYESKRAAAEAEFNGDKPVRKSSVSAPTDYEAYAALMNS